MTTNRKQTYFFFGLDTARPTHRAFLYQFDTKQDCLMLTVPKLLVVGLVLKSVQTEMSLADEQWVCIQLTD